ncbi:hypothetical protein GCM10022261_27230 [Brevibacterium daeguense]|uniref:ABC-2 type transport system permease protein n=1 Tax=Brevibacterium daeguense TaxID=909936 RepID=A0ABP8EMI9_9MICO|nr:hypothetical protein [Brevibacterium daeguense]
MSATHLTSQSLIGFRPALAAELLRTRRSAATWVPVAGLAIGVLQAASWVATATGGVTDWESLFFWHALYHTALLVPFAVMTAALSVARETRAREGGMLWRPIAHHTALLARFTVIAVLLGLLALAVTVPAVLIGLTAGLTDPPIGEVLTLALAQWLLSLFPAAVALGLAGLVGFLPTLLVGIAWQAAGTLLGETESWLLQPWTWSVRASLPLLGIHQNGVRLAPDSPIHDWSPWEPILASAIATVLVLLLWSALPAVRFGIRRPRIRRSREDRRAESDGKRTALPGAGRSGNRLVRRNVDLALVSALRRTPIPWGLALIIVSFVLITLVWTQSGIREFYLRGWISYVVVPFGACILAITTWNGHRDAWRILATRTSTNRLATSVVLIAAIQLIAVLMVGTIFIQGPEAPAFALLAGTTGVAALTVNLSLTARYGPGAALVLTLAAFAFGSIAATEHMTDTPIWPAAVFVWTDAYANTDRLGLALAISSAVATLGFLAWLRTARRAAAQ